MKTFGTGAGRPFLTDGGLETVLIFQHGMELPEFAAFPLLENEEGRRVLTDYLTPYLEIAEKHDAGFVFESVTWRANADWGKKLGYSSSKLAEVNRIAVEEALALRGCRR